MEAEDLVTLIANDKSHRAVDLVVISLRGLQIMAGTGVPLSEVLAGARAMQESRPGSVCLQNILDEFCRRLGTVEPGVHDLRAMVKQVCNGLAADMILAQDAVATRMAALIEDGECLMTHSLSSTINRVFEVARQQEKQPSAIVNESRPGMEGHLLARGLSKLGIETTVITESQIAVFMEGTDKVILGADRLLANGGVVNKAGSLPLALVAQRFNVPVYVCAESFKRGNDDAFEKEESDVEEIELPPLANVIGRNFYLEVLPADLITEVITDE